MATPLTNPSGKGPGQNPHHGAELGALLKAARERRGLTLEQVSKETKIPLRHLEALENDSLAFVPGEFYRRAEIRTYARAVNLDQTVVSAHLERVRKPPTPEEMPEAPKAEPPPQFRKAVFVGIGISVVLATAVLGGALWKRTTADSNARVVGATDSERRNPPAREGSAEMLVGTSQRAPKAASEVAPAAIPAPAPSADPVPEPAPTEPQAAAASVTTLVVRTEPEGARVTVNGIGWGAAPVTIRHLSAGDKHIRVSRDGYITEERVVPLAGGRTKVLDFQLRSTQ
jgi:cytoskeleton protein RodZ